jgi:uncharacterized membrane protein
MYTDSQWGELLAVNRTGSVMCGWHGGRPTYIQRTANGYSAYYIPQPVMSEYAGGAAKGISDDGLAVAGGVRNLRQETRAAYWRLTPDSGGWQGQVLGVMQGGNYSFAQGISRDGLTVIGIANTASAQATQAFRWTSAIGLTPLGLPPGVSSSEAVATNQDGSVIVGNMWNGSRYKAFRWTPQDGVQDIGIPTEFEEAWARGVSADGSIVVGHCTKDDRGTYRAFIWTAEEGIALLNDFAQARGFELDGVTLWQATAISADGAVVAGDCSTPSGERSFILRDLRPRACPSDLDGDGEVNAADISLLLLDFGLADGCSPDLDDTGEVDAADIALLLLDFGSCP